MTYQLLHSWLLGRKDYRDLGVNVSSQHSPLLGRENLSTRCYYHNEEEKGPSSSILRSKVKQSIMIQEFSRLKRGYKQHGRYRLTGNLERCLKNFYM